MPDLAMLVEYGWKIAVTLGGSGAFVASIKVTRYWGGMEAKFSSSLDAIKAVQAEVKTHGEAIASHAATLALLIPALANLPKPGKTTPRGNGPVPDIDTVMMSELHIVINRWVAERFEHERLMQEERD